MRPLFGMLVLAATAAAQPPSLKIEPEIRLLVCKSTEIPVTTDAASVVWLAVDPEVDFFPSAKLKDPKSAFVTVREPGRYVVFVVAASAKGEQTVAKTVLVVEGARPPPKPDPKPEPPVPPKPVSEQKLVVVVIEETNAAAQERAKFFNDAALAARITAKGHKVYALDKDVVGADGKPPASLAGYLAEAAGKKLPWVVIADWTGKKLFSGPVPLDAAAVLKLMMEYGG